MQHIVDSISIKAPWRREIEMAKRCEYARGAATSRVARIQHINGSLYLQCVQLRVLILLVFLMCTCLFGMCCTFVAVTIYIVVSVYELCTSGKFR